MSDGNTEDFAALFAASVQTRRLENGQNVDGRIVALGPEVAFVDVGAKGEATIGLDELRNEDGALEVGIGDRIQATVVSTRGGIVLSRKLQRGAATARQLADAFRAGLPVDGKVDGQIKGGYQVTVAGQRAFCPVSQIDIVRDSDPAAHIGRVYTFRIIEYAEGGRTLVVSRRALLDEEQRARADQARRSLTVGAVVAGRVVSVRDFGAFVDLGAGVQGLLHVSEMGWSRVTDASGAVAVGDEVTVKVLRVDDGKIAVGTKQLTDDPWASASARYPAGTRVRGTVERHAAFGVFVALAPGVVGLVPASETGVPREADARKALPVGAEVDVVVLEVDAERRRLRLSREAVAAAREADEVRAYEARQEAVAERPSLGTLADKLRNALGSRE